MTNHVYEETILVATVGEGRHLGAEATVDTGKQTVLVHRLPEGG